MIDKIVTISRPVFVVLTLFVSAVAVIFCVTDANTTVRLIFVGFALGCIGNITNWRSQ